MPQPQIRRVHHFEDVKRHTDTCPVQDRSRPLHVIQLPQPKYMIPWTTITSFGDLAIMAPAALAIMGWLVLAGEQRLALRWGTLFAIGMALAVATKIAFIGWGIGIRSLDFTGISGHAMRVAAVVPVLSYLILQKSSPMVRLSGVILGFLFAAFVGLSRLTLHIHSISEVASGFLLGSAVSLCFIRSAGVLQAHVLNRTRIAASLALLLVAPYAQPAPTQRWLTQATLYLSGHDKPFMRASWKHGHPRKHGLREL
jgi:membrane-associated phospholipid phosphatase